MQEMSAFGMKKCLSLPSLWWLFFNDEWEVGKGDERIYHYSDECLGDFVLQSINGGKVEAFIQLFDSPLPQNLSNILKRNSIFPEKKYVIS